MGVTSSVSNRTSVGILRLVFKYLALMAPGNRVYIDPNKERVHTLVYRVCQGFADDFQELRQLHFDIQGAFPYSTELFQDLGVLFSSGVFDQAHSLPSKFILIRWYGDSEAAVIRNLENRLGGDERLKARFEEMVEIFREIVKEEAELLG